MIGNGSLVNFDDYPYVDVTGSVLKKLDCLDGQVISKSLCIIDCVFIVLLLNGRLTATQKVTRVDWFVDTLKKL